MNKRQKKKSYKKNIKSKKSLGELLRNYFSNKVKKEIQYNEGECLLKKLINIDHNTANSIRIPHSMS